MTGQGQRSGLMPRGAGGSCEHTAHLCRCEQGNTDLWMTPRPPKSRTGPAVIQPGHVWPCHAWGSPGCPPAPQLLDMGLHGDTALSAAEKSLIWIRDFRRESLGICIPKR